MEQFAKLPKWGQWLVVLIVGGVLASLVYYFLIKDKQASNAALSKQIEELAGQIRQGKEAQRRLDELNRQMEVIQRDLDVLKSIIPKDPQTGTLLRAFQSFARDQNLDINKINAGMISEQEMYSQQPYTIEVTGGYHDIALLFDKLAHMRRIVNVTDMDLSSVTVKGQFAVKGLFSTMVFMQKPEPVDTQAATSGKAPEKKEAKP